MIIIAISSGVENNKLLVINRFCYLYNKILIDWFASAYVQQRHHPRNDDMYVYMRLVLMMIVFYRGQMVKSRCW